MGKAGAVALALAMHAISGHAAVYSGDWDPPFGALFPNLGFNGAITFFVPDACLSQGGVPFNGFVSNADACSGGGMSMLTAQVGLYNTAAPNQILQTLVFAPPAIQPDPIFGVYVAYDQMAERNVVIGLLSDFLGPQQSSLEISGNSSFFLRFGRTPFPNEPSLGDYALASIFTPQCLDQPSLEACQSNYATVTFRDVTNTVPEPGSLALVGGALGLAWALRRRAQPAA